MGENGWQFEWDITIKGISAFELITSIRTWLK